MRDETYALKIDQTSALGDKFSTSLKYVAGGLSDNKYIAFAQSLVALTTNTFNGVSLVTTAELHEDYTAEGDIA